MSSSLNRIKKNIIEAMQSANNQGTSAYDSVAEVRRVEGDTAWVHIAGGVDETPVKLTIAAKVGDVVQVRVGGGRAWITGNASAPPTDDKTAIVAKSLANIAGNRAKTAQKTADQAQIVADSALEGTKENATQMAQMVIDFNGDIENLQDQIDGNIATWFYDVDPTMDLPPVTDWDTDEKKDAHLGDIYYNTVKGYAWRFMKSGSTYSWERITDTDVTKALADAAKAQDTADSKRRVFYNTPTVPYDAGDLWVQGSGGDILRCAQAKKSTGSYDRNDWVLASKYTDDSALNTWIEGDFATTIQGLEEGLVDAKIETYYQTTDPSTGWSDIQKSEHEGDLWYNSTASVQKYYRWSGTAWQELTATPPQAVFDNIDKKATIYTGTTTPTNPDSGDLWFKGADEPILTYVNNSWVEYNKYTDDTRAEQAIEDAANAAKVATNYMAYGSDGLIIGNNINGTFSGSRAQVLPSSFNILDESGNALSSFGETTVIGYENEANLCQTFNKIYMRDKDKTEFFCVGDYRDSDGVATLKCVGDGEASLNGKLYIDVQVSVESIISVSVNGSAISSSDYTISGISRIVISNLTYGDYYAYEIEYTTLDPSTYLTFGNRNSSGRVGAYSVAEGIELVASGYCSHAEGIYTEASGKYSHAEGWGTIARAECQHVIGTYNIEDAFHKYAFIIGNGTSTTKDDVTTVTRSNALTVDWDGNLTVGGHDSPIGTKLEASKTNISIAAGIDKHHNGASLTLGKGVWIAIGRWSFNTRASGTASSNRQTSIEVNGTTWMSQRINTYGGNFGMLQCVAILNLTNESNTVVCAGSCSQATSGKNYDNSLLIAVRIA